MVSATTKAETQSRPQIKICGITRTRDALACMTSGADALGFVFYPPSPRNLPDTRARRIIAALPATVRRVGVFVNASYEAIMSKVGFCGLNAVQLHGREAPELVAKLRAQKLKVIKALFIEGTPGLDTANQYEADAFLLECARGKLPGGNAQTWDWQAAADFGRRHPLVLAGGLAPGNIGRAIAEAQPDAVDVSSGVETAPGIKDAAAINAFCETVRKCELNRLTRRIF